MKEHEIVVCGIPFETDCEREALEYVKSKGFTSVQIYMHWAKYEPEKRGEFDWSFYDREINLLKEYGLKFVPFFIMGPRYVAPDWWLKDPKHIGLVCIEHGKECPIDSIWNPAFREEVDRVMKAFAEHYLPMNVLESFQPGISGDYGEAIFPVQGNWPGVYHGHRGFWCGDRLAVADFRGWLKEKYSDISALNTAWRACYSSFEEIVPVIPHKAPSKTAHLDMLDWYRGSMDEYTDFWMACSRKHFPNTPIYLCTGGSEEPEHGSLFSTQARIAAKYGGGIRLTNEGNNFFVNLHNTVHGVSACKFYGAYMGLEPVGPMLKSGVNTRTFGSAVYGNRQIFHYYGNLIDANNEYTGSGDEILKYSELISEKEKNPPVTLFWPMAQSQISGEDIPADIKLAISEIRKLYEVQVADETMILDGFLDTTKTLIMVNARFTRTEVLERIADWVEKGGNLLSNCRTRSIELEGVPVFDKLFGINEDSDEAYGHSSFKISKSDWAKSLSGIESFHSQVSWAGLDKDVIPLASCKCKDFEESRQCYAAFEKVTGKGRAVMFTGSLDLNAPADALFTPSPAFEYLLKDFCLSFSGSEPFELRDNEQIRGRIGDKTYALTSDYEIIEV